MAKNGKENGKKAAPSEPLFSREEFESLLADAGGEIVSHLAVNGGSKKGPQQVHITIRNCKSLAKESFSTIQRKGTDQYIAVKTAETAMKKLNLL